MVFWEIVHEIYKCMVSVKKKNISEGQELQNIKHKKKLANFFLFLNNSNAYNVNIK